MINDWKDKGILEPTRSKDPKTVEYRYKSWKATTLINEQRIKGVKIPFEQLRTLLSLRDENLQDMKNSNEIERIETLHISLIESCELFLRENPELKNVTYTPKEVAENFIRSKTGKSF